MAFKKGDRSYLAPRKFSVGKAQSIFEYVILTAVVVATVLIFGPHFDAIKKSCDDAFNRSVAEIVK
ncbi:MAG: hypothetical protein KKC39_02005 [Candidatus Omnitrophica bacterium]|nr:hypothetical protein [Candidatus Omnitrophota bacterium]MBU4418969.1 hypothetical protein [Candidatus Omnitrophota bacterium]MBU4467507.1 hypothetical protein [Candidatus Omnitrophota bacterium]MCG2713310.1 hypothetical protein [Candidatus Omnitrophota bacterium]